MNRINDILQKCFWIFDTYEDLTQPGHDIKEIEPKESAICTINFVTLIFLVVFLLLLYILKEGILLILSIRQK
jgi:hypothetical protein